MFLINTFVLPKYFFFLFFIRKLLDFPHSGQWWHRGMKGSDAFSQDLVLCLAQNKHSISIWKNEWATFCLRENPYYLGSCIFRKSWKKRSPSGSSVERVRRPLLNVNPGAQKPLARGGSQQKNSLQLFSGALNVYLMLIANLFFPCLCSSESLCKFKIM